MDERIVGGVTRVVVGRDVVDEAAEGLTGSVAVLCQPGVRHVADSVVRRLARSGAAVSVLEMPDGDEAKSLAHVDRAAGWLAGEGLRRDGTIVAVGGGALTDMAGFLASIYMRGIAVRYVPTTLLGAIDASIGGKTAINVAGKNVLGTFRHPDAVIIDLDVIGAIGSDLMAEGMAEALKAGAIGDLELFCEIERNGLAADLELVVDRALAVKAAVVEADFREVGVRAHLNFGHTIGHAIETACGWRHGPSVAVGMLAAAAASEIDRGFRDTDRLRAAIAGVGLAVRAPSVDPDEVIRLVAMDKKSDVVGLRMVLLDALGEPVMCRVDSATLGSALAAVGIGGS